MRGAFPAILSRRDAAEDLGQQASGRHCSCKTLFSRKRPLLLERQPFNYIDPVFPLRGLGNEFKVANVLAYCAAKLMAE